MTEHPIRRADVQAAVEQWTEKVLAETGSGTVIVEFNVKDRRFLSIQLGGTASRMPLDNAASRGAQ